MSNQNVEFEKSISQTNQSIVYFDGVCGLCNNTVDFLLTKDRKNRLLFAPLQGETARKKLSNEDRNLDSIVLQQGDQTWKRSSAIVRILLKLPHPWKFFGYCFWVIPKPVRDICYTIVAQLRYRMFGKHETCRMPTEADRAKLLR